MDLKIKDGITMTNQISSLQLAGIWPKYHYDIKNTGQSPYTSYADGTIKWYYSYDQVQYGPDYGQDVRGSPAVDSDGTVYIGDSSGKFYAFNPDGTMKWSSPVGGGGYSTPVISSDGTIYNAGYDPVGTYGLYAFNPYGIIKWIYPIYLLYETTPAISPTDGTIYISGSEFDPTYGYGIAVLYAINPDGSLKWLYWSNTTGLQGSGKSRPAIGPDGKIYVKMDETDISTYILNIYLDAINPNDGTRIWRTFIGNFGDRAQCSAIGSDGTIYIAMGYEDPTTSERFAYLYAINPIDGPIIWQTQIGNYSIESCPAVASDGTIYIGSKNVDPITYQYSYYMYAVNPDGTIKSGWPYQTLAEPRSPPMIGQDGTIYFGTNGVYNDTLGYSLARFYALNPDGTLKWSQDISTNNSIVSSPSMATDGTIYVGVDGSADPAVDKRVVAFQSLPAGCPIAPKYSGDTVTLQATPKDGIGPYYVVFRKNGATIDSSRLGGLPNPIPSASENTLITRIYILDDLDISFASTGTIDFSVYMEDSCPTGTKTCTDICTITIGCLTPVCNFTVT